MAMRPTLVPHPQSTAPPVAIEVDVLRDGRTLTLSYALSGSLDRLVIPSAKPPSRTDYLWKTSCFEAFIRISNQEKYVELNFSPSTQWAAYAFDSYRLGMRDADVTPEIVLDFGVSACLLSTTVLPPAFANAPLQLGLSAIIEGKDGSKSWYALAHPPGAPDFHHADCFALELAPREAS